MDPIAQIGPAGISSTSLSAFIDSDVRPEALNSAGDWASVSQDEHKVFGSINGTAVSISGEPDPNEFTQGETFSFYRPALSPEGDLYVVVGVPDSQKEVLAGAKLMRLDPRSIRAQGETIYEWKNPIPLDELWGGNNAGLRGKCLIFQPCTDFSRAVVAEITLNTSSGAIRLESLTSIDLGNATPVYRWSNLSYVLPCTFIDQSVDGRFVAYREFTEDGKEMSLTFVDVDAQTTSLIARVKYNSDDLTALSLSPDGKRLLATRSIPLPETPGSGYVYKLGLSVFDTSTGVETPLTSDSGTRSCYRGCWLPSGGEIVFLTGDKWPNPGSEDLWTMNADGSAKTRLFSARVPWALRFVR